MEFKMFRDAVNEQINEMCKNAPRLFEVEVDKDELWDTYLKAFPEGTNPIYRERTEHDCSCCRSFIKNIGAAVSIKNGVITTIWDVDLGDSFYQVVADAMAAYVKSKNVCNVYMSPFVNLGAKQNYEHLENGNVIAYDHFYVTVPGKCLNTTSRSLGTVLGEYKSTKDVFKRSLTELTEDSVLTVLELTAQKSLYKGEEWVGVLREFLNHKRRYDALTSDAEKDLYAWEKSIDVGPVIGRIRNHSIGVLLTDISNGEDLDVAVSKYEKIVAPSNYKRPNAIFTKKMLEDAQKTVQELGYMDSLQRRFATLDDITINNILFSNKDAAKRIKGADDIFGAMAQEVTTNPKKFSKVEEITIEDFVDKVLPTVTELEVLLENKHVNNMVSLIAPENKDSKTMFKWNNGFSWAYTGNITDSMKERVKSAGGKVDGVLRFSIQWNEDGNDNYDLDAHCVEPTGNEIYYGYCRKPAKSALGGQLDVDIIHPDGAIAVENITWPDKEKMKPGVYKFFVHQFSGGNNNGFRAEIEFDGQIYNFNYNEKMRNRQTVDVAEVTLHNNGSFTIKELLPSSVSSRDVWGVKTNQFIPVSVMCYSPNYWDEQDGVGNKHYFFMLKDCINPEMPNGMFNEFLKQELAQHKRVFEALGARMHVKDNADQLSGLGFSSTLRNDLIVKVKGQTERTLKIKF